MPEGSSAAFAAIITGACFVATYSERCKRELRAVGEAFRHCAGMALLQAVRLGHLLLTLFFCGVALAGVYA